MIVSKGFLSISWALQFVVVCLCTENTQSGMTNTQLWTPNPETTEINRKIKNYPNQPFPALCENITALPWLREPLG